MQRDAETGNPFVDYRTVLLDGHYGTADKLRALVLTLWNGQLYPMTGLGSLLSNSDDEHLMAAFSILKHYAEFGENCDDFMAVAEEIRDRKKADEAYAAGDDDGYKGRPMRNIVDVPHQRMADYERGYNAGQRDRELGD